MEHLDSADIHLWLCFYEPLRDQALLNEYVGLLSADELRQQRRFYFERDRHRYLITRALVRTVLSRYASIAPTQWLFATNAYGKPRIANEDDQARRICFNLSHTNGLIVLGVALDRAIGVDVENVRAQKAAVEIADRFFAPGEVAALRALPDDKQGQRFFEYWTLKESYIKARGVGLSIPLDRFAFDVDRASEIGLTIDASLGDDPRRWMFWQLAPAGEHLIAVCADRRQGGDVRLQIRESVPCTSDSAYRPPSRICSTTYCATG